jgi:hypothetical protein
MRLVSKKEAEKLRTMKNGNRSRVRAEMEAMDVGQTMVLDRTEWTRKTQVPSAVLRQIEAALKRKYRCEMLIDRSGWVIERLE